MKITAFTQTSRNIFENKAKPVKLKPRVLLTDLPIDKTLVTNFRYMGYKGLLDHQLKAFSFFYPIEVPNDLAVKQMLIKKDNAFFHKQFSRIMLSFNTSAGKTIIAMLFLDAYLRRSFGGKAVYCVPYKALADEMAQKFQKVFKGIWKVGISTGDFSSVTIKNIDKFNIIIITYHKLDSLLRKDKSGKLRSLISCVAIDEFHMIGPVLEDVVVKLKTTNIPIIALSATVGNRKELGEWLSDKDIPSVIVHSDFRPVKLKRGIFVHSKEPYIEFEDGSTEKMKILAKNSFTNAVVNFLDQGMPTIMFRQTRNNTMKTAASVSSWISGHRQWRTKRVKTSKTSSGEALDQVIQHKCAFHHAGMVRADKNTVESLFRERKLAFIAATTTLSTGINMPASVGFVEIMRYNAEKRGMVPISKNECLQCMGRIGRPQYDSYGTAMIILNGEKKTSSWIHNTVEQLKEDFFVGPPDPIFSSYHEKKNLSSVILGAIAGEYARNVKGLEEYLKKSLAYIQFQRDLNRNTDDVLYEMTESNYPLIKLEKGNFVATKLGKLVNSLYIQPSTAYVLIDAIKKLSGTSTDLAIVFWAAMTTDFRTFYPKSSMQQGWIDTLEYRKEELGLSSELFEISTELIRAIMTATVLMGSKNIHDAWTKETSIKDLERQWLIQGGDLYAVTGGRGSADWIMHAFSILAKMFGKKELGEKCETIGKQIKHGVKKELLPLINIRQVGRARARAFYRANYKRPEDLAVADASKIAQIRISGKELGLKNAQKIVYSAGFSKKI